MVRRPGTPASPPAPAPPSRRCATSQGQLQQRLRGGVILGKYLVIFNCSAGGSPPLRWFLSFFFSLSQHVVATHGSPWPGDPSRCILGYQGLLLARGSLRSHQRATFPSDNSFPFLSPSLLWFRALTAMRGGDGFESKSRRQEDAELLLLSEASGLFSVSIPGVIFPGPSVNKAIHYGSLSVAPQARRRPLPPPQALSAPAGGEPWRGAGVTGHASAGGSNLRASAGEEGSSGNWNQVCKSPVAALHGSPRFAGAIAKSRSVQGDLRDTDALPRRDMEKSRYCLPWKDGEETRPR